MELILLKKRSRIEHEMEERLEKSWEKGKEGEDWGWGSSNLEARREGNSLSLKG